MRSLPCCNDGRLVTPITFTIAHRLNTNNWQGQSKYVSQANSETEPSGLLIPGSTPNYILPISRVWFKKLKSLSDSAFTDWIVCIFMTSS